MIQRVTPIFVFGLSLLFGVFLLVASYQYRTSRISEIFTHSPYVCGGGGHDSGNNCNDPVDHPDKPPGEPNYILICNSLVVSATTVTPGQTVTGTITGSTTMPGQPVTNGDYSDNDVTFQAATPIGNNTFTFSYTVPITATGPITIQGRVGIPAFNWYSAGAACRVTLTVQIPTPTPSSSPSPTPAPKTCGATPCTSAAGQPNSCGLAPNGTQLVCITATNGLTYCSMPAYQAACGANPNSTTCCTAPTPSPTPTSTPTPSPTPPPAACYQPCSLTNPNSCGSGMTCQTVGGQPKCVNPQCSDQPNCVCQTLACVELTPKQPNLSRNQSATFTCLASGNAGKTANFQVLLNSTSVGGMNNVTLTNNQAQWTYTVPADALGGDYTVQCQICDQNLSCSPWGAAL